MLGFAEGGSGRAITLVTFNQSQSLEILSWPHSHSHKARGMMGALGKMGGPPSPWGFLPRCPHVWEHSLLTGLHQLYEVREENIPIPLAEAADIIGDLEGDGIGGCEGLRLEWVGGLTAQVVRGHALE